MSESECEFYGLLRHNYTVDVRFYLFTVGFRKCQIIYGLINETPLYVYWTTKAIGDRTIACVPM